MTESDRLSTQAESHSDSLFYSEEVLDHHSGQRLDHIAAELFNDFSRSRLQSWIKGGQLTVDGMTRKPKDKLLGGEKLTLHAELEAEERWLPQAISLNIVYQDEHIIVINKPAGLVVHPGAGVPDQTLLNGLLHHFPELATIPRAGIVHRLDKETSGLMVVARSLLAHASLIEQLQDRSVGREYEAIVMGEMTGGGKVDKPIGRHPTNRIKMAVLDARADQNKTAKEAITHYRLKTRFKRYTHIACKLETGRTHQIRVHMAYIKHPLVGDPVYLGRQRWLAGTEKALKQVLIDFPRQALHAKKLTLVHPESDETMSWESELPEDMQHLLLALKTDQQS
ncbi:MAG: 23S rRNA pseudouridine(1911/1915/1917) synthase RluD [Cellvibrionaceae bacterium]